MSLHPRGMRPVEAFSTEDRYRLLVDAVTDYALYMLDPDGFVVSWNSGAQRLKGYAEHEIVGRHFSQFYPEEDVRNGMPARALQTAAQEGRFEAEGWRVRKNGKRFWAHVVVDPILTPTRRLLGFAKITRDLSAAAGCRGVAASQRRTVPPARAGRDRLRNLHADPHGIVTSWNAGAQRIKGYAPDEVIGTHFSRFYRPEDAAAGLPALALATAAAEGRFESEGWRVRKDGTQFRANVVVDPIRSVAGGDIIGFAKITRDVTEKYETELALERAREALFQSQKLDAIGQLTGGVAHDFNNLLMVILTSLELIRRRMPDDETLSRLVNNAVQGAKRGATLTQRMLAFARRQELKPVAVDVAELVLGMRDLLERSLGPTIRLVTEFPDALHPVLIDANQLELAILNLAVNARDAMPQGGTLRVFARLESVAGDSATLAAGSCICLSIVDDGIGMDAATLTHATEPFFTTKGAGKGTGLGLPMVHGLAAQSGGRLILTSSVCVGTTVELWLPTAQTDAAAAGPGAVVEEAQRATSMLIVAVDDDALVLEGTVSMLQDLGHRVLPASSGPQALDVILNESGVSLLITDQMMPGMSGAELIERLACVRPRIPAILATGFGEVPADLDHMALRLAKPYDQNQLADAIQKVFASSVSRRAA